MPIKLIAVDLDGTLLTSDYTISPADESALKKAVQQGIQIVISTGRSEAESRIYASQIGSFEYMITHAGACLYHCPSSQYVASQALARQTTHHILSILDEYDDVFFEAYSLNRGLTTQRSYRNFHTCGLRSGFLTITSPMLHVVPESDQISANYDIHKFFLCSTNPHTISMLKSRVAEVPNVQVVSSLSTALEFYAPNADKGRTLAALSQKFHIPKEEIMCIGDSENDIGLFLNSGVSAAMGNAFDCLKQMADIVVRSHDHSGVAQAIEYALLQR